MQARLKTHQKVLIAAVVAVTGLLLLAVGVYAYDTTQEDQIAPGITVGGVDIGGRSVDEARAVIEDEVVAPLQKPVVVEYDGETYRLSSKRLDQDADVEGMLDEAVERTREGSLVDRVARYVQGSEVDAELEPQVSYSEEAVDKFVAELAAEINRDPQNASIEPSGDTLTPTPGEPGRALREDEVRDAIVAEVEEPGSGKEILAQVQRTAPEITTKELRIRVPDLCHHRPRRVQGAPVRQFEAGEELHGRNRRGGL